MREINDYLDRVHEINYRMLCEIDRICEENGIRYYLLAGTLLGVIRHKDFIPWDDDVDIVFARKDYERFVRLFRQECSDERYELVDYHEHSEFFDFICRVVDKSVTLRNLKADDNYYQGRYAHPSVDLFVFDNISSHFSMQLLGLRIVYALAMGHRPYVDYGKYNGIYRIGAHILPTIGRLIPFKYIAWLYDMISAAGRGNSGAWFISNDQQRDPYWGKKYKKEWFKRRVKGQIRDRFFPCPAGAKAELRMIYGDFMKLPPVDKRLPEHFMTLEGNN